jgi:hypothetical protein
LDGETDGELVCGDRLGGFVGDAVGDVVGEVVGEADVFTVGLHEGEEDGDIVVSFDIFCF